MTGPIIPAGQWPEGAVALVWSVFGLGKWVMVDSSSGTWEVTMAGVPMPAGWDWRVPVMRPVAEAKPVAVIPTGHPTSVVQWLGPMPPQGTYLYAAPHQPPAIDLEQFRCHIERSKRYLAVCTDSSGGSTIARELAGADRLLALIDGQAKSSDTQRLEWLMRNISGAELRRLNVWTDASCDRTAIDKAMQPTKGEGE